MASAGARTYIGVGGEAPSGGSGAEPLVEVRERSPPPEAESSVAFETPAEEPNLTLVTDSFCSSHRDVHYKVVFGGLNLPLSLPQASSRLSSPLPVV